MATVVRQRVPFKFSEDGEDQGHILDEQEQEEVINRLRTESEHSNIIYLTGLQIVIGLSFVIHVMFMFSPTKVSPLANLLPGALTHAVPFATGLTILQLVTHLNLGLLSLPQDNSYRRMIHNSAPSRFLALSLPLSHPVATILPAVAPTYALVLARGPADVLWWAVPGLLTGLVALVRKWMGDEERDLEELEKLRYTARGA